MRGELKHFSAPIDPRLRSPYSLGRVVGASAVLVLIAAGVAFLIFGGDDTKQRQAATRLAAEDVSAVGGTAEPTPPLTKVVKEETFGDWLYTCVEPPGGDPIRCAISQEISRAETNTILFLWRIAEDGSGGLVSYWQTPTDIHVDRGLTLDAGTPKPLTIPFQTCTTKGCQATAKLGSDFLQTLSTTTKAKVTLYLLTGRGVAIDLSVKGLPEALSALQSSGH